MGTPKFCKVMLNSGEPVFDCAVADDFCSRLVGIMFKRHFHYSALLFKDAYWIHSFFCFVRFHIVFLDKNFNVIRTFYNVPPNKILPPIWKSKYVIEFFDENIIFNVGDKVKIEEL